MLGSNTTALRIGDPAGAHFKMKASTVSMPVDALRQPVEPLLRACARVFGEEDALNAARFAVSWVTGFVQMEFAGAFRLGGDVDVAFEYGLRRLGSGLHP